MQSNSKKSLICSKKTKKLTHTIKTILQTFPEGVIIRTPDQVSNSVIIKFTNDFIKHNFSNTNSEQPNDISSTQVNIVHEKDNSNSLESENSLTLDEFLWSQEMIKGLSIESDNGVMGIGFEGFYESRGIVDNLLGDSLSKNRKWEYIKLIFATAQFPFHLSPNVNASARTLDLWRQDGEGFIWEILSCLRQEMMFINSELEDQQSVENIIEVRSQPDHINMQPNENEQDSQCQVFNVKTIQVLWVNNPSSFMHVFINTTQVRKLEEMKAKNKWQKLMFASASHEFRTPLNAFVNSLQIIDMTIESFKQLLAAFGSAQSSWEQFYPTLDKMITIGRISLKLLLNLIEDILDLAKFDANRFELNIGEFKLRDVVNEVNSIFKFQCQERRLEFKIEWSSRIYNKEYRSDAKRVKQVIINLVSNSLKFTMYGRIVLSIREIRRQRHNYLEFSVYDTIVGIKRKDIAKLFVMFNMIENNRRLLNQSGTGIGLWISKKLVESLGGEIDVKSEENNWTQFTFTKIIILKILYLITIIFINFIFSLNLLKFICDY